MFKKDTTGIPMFSRVRSEFQCLEGEDQNSNFLKDKTRIAMFERKGEEF